METTRYKCEQLLLIVREHMRLARPVNESELLDKMEAYMTPAPKQGEWKPEIGEVYQFSDHITFLNWRELVFIGMFEGKYVGAAKLKNCEWPNIFCKEFMRPLEKSLDEKLREILEGMNFGDATSRCGHLERYRNDAIAKIKSLFTVKMPSKEECVAEYNRLLKVPALTHDNALWEMTKSLINTNQNQGR